MGLAFGFQFKITAGRNRTGWDHLFPPFLPPPTDGKEMLVVHNLCVSPSTPPPCLLCFLPAWAATRGRLFLFKCYELAAPFSFYHPWLCPVNETVGCSAHPSFVGDRLQPLLLPLLFVVVGENQYGWKSPTDSESFFPFIRFCGHFLFPEAAVNAAVVHREFRMSGTRRQQRLEVLYSGR